MTAHSPTPWALKEHHADFSIEDANGRTLAYIGQFLNDVDQPLGMDEIRANADALTAAAELLEACEAQRQAIDMLFARLILLTQKHTPSDLFMPSASGAPWEALVKGNAAIAKARVRP